MPIMDAEVELSGSGLRKKVTGADGVYNMARLHTGIYTLTIRVVGFVTQTKTIHVTQNGMVTTNFVMVATGETALNGGGTTGGVLSRDA